MLSFPKGGGSRSLFNLYDDPINMSIDRFYPRKVGERFFLVDTQENMLHAVNEAVFELVSASKGVAGFTMETVMVKYGLTPVTRDLAFEEIASVLNEIR